MGTAMGAAGARIEMYDNSAYSVVTASKAIAGIVGYAPKGELNKIQRITSTSEMNTYFGLGFNQSRYNQGLYGARAVLDAGGYVEYVRPYGEEIDLSNDYKRDLKADAYVVSFDRDPMNLTKESGAKKNDTNTSLQMEYFASTRYKVDGAANYGVTRKINNIAEVVEKNSNIDFNVDADDYASSSSRSRGDTDMVLFSMIGADPSIANRAFTRYDVSHVSDLADNDSGVSIYQCTANPGFSAGSYVYAPAGSGESEMVKYLVTNIVDRKIFLSHVSGTVTGNATVLYYFDDDNAAADGYDYLTVKTAVAGRGSKLFGGVQLTTDGVTTLKSVTSGAAITFYDSKCNPVDVRFKTSTAYSGTVSTFKYTNSDTRSSSPVTITVSSTANLDCLEIDDEIKITQTSSDQSVKDGATATYTVVSVSGNTITANPSNASADIDDYDSSNDSKRTITVAGSDLSDNVPCIDVTGSKTASEIMSELAEIIAGSDMLNYGTSVIATDITSTSFETSAASLTVTKGTVFDFSIDDTVVIVADSGKSTTADVTPAMIVASGTVKSVNGYTDTITLKEGIGASSVDGVKYKLINLTQTNRKLMVSNVEKTVKTESGTTTKVISEIYLVGNYVNSVNMDTQRSTVPFSTDTALSTVFTYSTLSVGHIVESSEKVLMDSEIGATFISFGLATVRYLDVNYTGKSEKVYDLTDEGEAIARIYMSVKFKYSGTLYEFEGTIVPYVYNNTQLSIAMAAENELTGTGVKFMLNDSGALDMFLEDNSYDLSGTVVNGKPSSTSTVLSYNVNDPAIIHDAVWTYKPANNCSTSTIASAYSLFLDKDTSDVAFFVAAGMGVNNFGLKSYESLNTTVMQAILNVCELRKDCFALFDGVNEKDIEKALKKEILASRFSSALGRWGMIYDARPVFYDSIITLDNVECAPSVAMANLIMSNRSDSIYWRSPSGKDTGRIPSAWCTSVRNPRNYSYPENPDSDIARLSDIHVNPFRTTNDGIYAYMDYTMQMEDTAYNQAHVIMLMAGVHKMLWHYLDGMVFKLNTPALRSQIQTNIQAQLDHITASNPQGFISAQCICDETNNTQSVINQNKLYVDIHVNPPKSSRFITLRSYMESSENGNTITSTIE